MPGQDGIGLDDGGDLAEDSAAQFLPDFCECLAFSVGQVETPVDLCA